MNDLKPTFEKYYPAGSIGPGSGELRGQCAVYCQHMVVMPLVGNTIETKTASVTKSGILAKDLNGDIRVGDVLVLDVGTKAGHLAIVNKDMGHAWRLSESNWKNDLRVTHDRLLLKNTKQIVGIFRGALRVQIINPPTPPKPMKPILKVAVIDDKQEWADFDQQILRFKQLAEEWSGGKMEVEIVQIVRTNFKPEEIEYEAYSSNFMGTFKGPSRAWQKANIYQHRKGADAILFNMKETPVTIQQGYALAPDEVGGPFVLMVETGRDLNFEAKYGMSVFTKIAVHELAHELRMTTGQESLPLELWEEQKQIYSWTHYYDYHPDHHLSEAFSTLDFERLAQNLELRRQQGKPMVKFFKAKQGTKAGILIQEGFSGTLLFEDKWAEYQTLLGITAIPANAPTIEFPEGRFFKIQDGQKLGIVVVEGFTGSILYENDFAEYQTLKKITGITDQTPTIQIPQT